MVIRSIKLQNFRSYELYETSFDEQITVITGKNGVGKTNLLESIYMLLQGSSFRASDRDVLQYQKDWWRLDGVIDDHVRQVRFTSVNTPSKQIVINEQMKRFSYSHKLPVVLFEPNDMLFISGSPSRRRDTVDTMISAYSREYKKTLARYNRILLQRNNALKKYQHSSEVLRDMLFVWDISLANYAEILVRQRAEFVEKLNQKLPYYYERIATSYHDVRLVYQNSLPIDTSATQLLGILHKNTASDIEKRTTTKGPHRDDYTFFLQGSEAKNTASRGENRSLLLSLKLAYKDILREIYETEPIVLLDDVFSELDRFRRKNLLDNTVDNQVVITDTHHIAKVKTILL